MQKLENGIINIKYKSMNKTITEDFVSFEVSKLLKEKGFDSEDTGEHVGFYSERCPMQTIGSQMMFGFNIQNVQGDLLSKNTKVAYDSYEHSEMDAIKYTLENLI